MEKTAVRVVGSVEKVDVADLSYDDFVERFMRPNLPVVLTGLSGWRAAADWVAADGKPNLSFFASRFPSSMLPVADCSGTESVDQKRFEMSMKDFINQWPHDSDSDDAECSSANSLLYLKDWHFVKEYPDYVAYMTPVYFVDDWLNMYLDSHPMHRDADISHHKNDVNCTDYRFVYMGPKGTWTPLHADVFRSYSWSANVCGRKLWLLLPPSQSHLLFDRNLKYTVYDINGEVSEKKFPHFNKTEWIQCIQGKNEAIFVPSGWYHQVHNVEDTISINHNWFNSYNLSWVWNLLLEDYKIAKEYIEDIRDISEDFEALCQRNLAANSGMNFHDFFIFITRFTLANIVELHHIWDMEDDVSNPPNYTQRSIINNLTAIRSVASKMKAKEAFAADRLTNISSENQSALCDIAAILKEESFQKLLQALSRTYAYIREGKRSHTSGDAPHGKACLSVNCVGGDRACTAADRITAAVSRIYGPADLVLLIDSVIHTLPSTSSDGGTVI